MPTPEIQKENLRRALKQERRKLSAEAWQQRSLRIASRLFETKAFQTARTVHCYLASVEKREVDTDAILKELWRRGCTVFAPVVTSGAPDALGELGHVEIDAHTAFEVSTFGIREPSARLDKPVITLANDELKTDVVIDMVIMPLLACDRRGNRVGYGHGYYDRFLAKLHRAGCKPLCLGLAFDFQVVSSVPAVDNELHRDQPLDMILTESEVIVVKS